LANRQGTPQVFASARRPKGLRTWTGCLKTEVSHFLQKSREFPN
jgi:hypothetical protein